MKIACHWLQEFLNKSTSKHLLFNDQSRHVKQKYVGLICARQPLHVCVCAYVRRRVQREVKGSVCLLEGWVTAVWHNVIYSLGRVTCALQLGYTCSQHNDAHTQGTPGGQTKFDWPAVPFLLQHNTTYTHKHTIKSVMKYYNITS